MEQRPDGQSTKKLEDMKIEVQNDKVQYNLSVSVSNRYRHR